MQGIKDLMATRKANKVKKEAVKTALTAAKQANPEAKSPIKERLKKSFQRVTGRRPSTAAILKKELTVYGDAPTDEQIAAAAAKAVHTQTINDKKPHEVRLVAQKATLTATLKAIDVSQEHIPDSMRGAVVSAQAENPTAENIGVALTELETATKQPIATAAKAAAEYATEVNTLLAGNNITNEAIVQAKDLATKARAAADFAVGVQASSETDAAEQLTNAQRYAAGAEAKILVAEADLQSKFATDLTKSLEEGAATTASTNAATASTNAATAATTAANANPFNNDIATGAIKNAQARVYISTLFSTWAAAEAAAGADAETDRGTARAAIITAATTAGWTAAAAGAAASTSTAAAPADLTPQQAADYLNGLPDNSADLLKLAEDVPEDIITLQQKIAGNLNQAVPVPDTGPVDQVPGPAPNPAPDPTALPEDIKTAIDDYYAGASVNNDSPITLAAGKEYTAVTNAIAQSLEEFKADLQRTINAESPITTDVQQRQAAVEDQARTYLTTKLTAQLEAQQIAESNALAEQLTNLVNTFAEIPDGQKLTDNQLGFLGKTTEEVKAMINAKMAQLQAINAQRAAQQEKIATAVNAEVAKLTSVFTNFHNVNCTEHNARTPELEELLKQARDLAASTTGGAPFPGQS